MTVTLSIELRDALTGEGWTLSDDRKAITRTFRFSNFIEAFGWMTQVAIWAEKWNHHPEWSNTYDRVEVKLTTHDAGDLTELDAKLARKMDQLASG